jgi:hypothetical protein
LFLVLLPLTTGLVLSVARILSYLTPELLIIFRGF